MYGNLKDAAAIAVQTMLANGDTGTAMSFAAECEKELIEYGKLRANQLPANVVEAVRAYALAYQEEHNAITALEPDEERCRLADLAAAKALGDFQFSISQWRIESDAKERG